MTMGNFTSIYLWKLHSGLEQIYLRQQVGHCSKTHAVSQNLLVNSTPITFAAVKPHVGLKYTLIIEKVAYSLIQIYLCPFAV